MDEIKRYLIGCVSISPQHAPTMPTFVEQDGDPDLMKQELVKVMNFDGKPRVTLEGPRIVWTGTQRMAACCVVVNSRSPEIIQKILHSFEEVDNA